MKSRFMRGGRSGSRPFAKWALLLGAFSLFTLGCSADPEGSPGDGGGGSGGGEACDAPSELQVGLTYGDYTFFAVRLEEDIEPGDYHLGAQEDSPGEVVLTRDEAVLGTFPYDVDASLAGTMTQTIELTGYFELDVRSVTTPDLSLLAETIFNGCFFVRVEAAPTIEEGLELGFFVIEDLTVEASAAAGTYTLYAESGNAGSVELRRDGELVDTLVYDWTTTIDVDMGFTFVFPDVVSITVRRTMGSSNLFGLGDTLFDGRHELVVP
jgi:hypothetical protein